MSGWKTIESSAEPVLMAENIPSGLLEACVVLGVSNERLKELVLVRRLKLFISVFTAILCKIWSKKTMKMPFKILLIIISNNIIMMTHTQTHTDRRTHTQTHTDTRTHTDTDTRTHTHTQTTHTDRCTHTHTHTDTCTHTHTHTQTQTHTDTRTHTHRHTHTDRHSIFMK